MRIAISGTHSMGKTTLVQDFAKAHPDYKVEIEPYRALRKQVDIPLAEDATKLGNTAMLEYSIQQAEQYTKTSKVIFDRAPVDMLAYSIYARDKGKSDIDTHYINEMIPRAKYAMQLFDIIVFLPITDLYPMQLEDDGIRPTNPQYRIDVDTIFKDIYERKLYPVFPSRNVPFILPLWGTREERIKKLTDFIDRIQTQ